MKDILAQAQREVLAQLAWSNVLLGFDYDGTLAPIVTDPARAKLGLRTRRLLAELARSYPCVVISGRALGDIRPKLAGVELRGIIGNHGLEPLSATDKLASTVRRWRTELALHLDGVAGVQIEDKLYSLAIHFRRSRQRRLARAAIARALDQLGPVRIIGGKCVVNVVPLGAPHKGIALERERERLGCDTAFFLGDDVTDEDVFALDQPGRLLTVRVGNSRVSHASYYLRSRNDVDELLRRFIDLRRADVARSPRFAQ